MFVPERWSIFENAKTMAKMMTTMDIMTDTLDPHAFPRDLDVMQIGASRPFDSEEAEFDICSDEGYTNVMNVVMRLKDQSAVWLHLPHDTWLTTQPGHSRTLACPNGNFLNEDAVRDRKHQTRTEEYAA